MPGIEPQFLDYPAYSLVTVGYMNATQPVWKSDIDQEPYNSCVPFDTALRGGEPYNSCAPFNTALRGGDTYLTPPPSPRF